MGVRGLFDHVGTRPHTVFTLLFMEQNQGQVNFLPPLIGLVYFITDGLKQIYPLCKMIFMHVA